MTIDSSTSLAFSLGRATRSDIPTLARIAHEAFKSDRHTQLKSLPEYGGYNHGLVMADALSSWLERPEHQCHVVKATADETGEILGWVCWGFRGYGEEPERTEALPNDTSKTGIERLNDMTSSDLHRWMDVLMPQGAKCMFSMSIVVSPSHQGTGIGSALVRYGTNMADQDQVFCWAHTSEQGHAVFAKEGFRQVGILEVDLDEFVREEAERPRASDKRTDVWGVYRFRYMRRP